jgi:hypothetical protein
MPEPFIAPVPTVSVAVDVDLIWRRIIVVSSKKHKLD